MTTEKAYDLTPTLRSRTLRTQATPAERRLWSALRNRELEGVRFNRQVPIGPFICDFVARSTKLVVEADGGQHGEAIGYDETRTRWLEAHGNTVLRFWNDEIMRNLDGVITTILNALVELRAIPPLPPAREGSTREANGGGSVLAEGNRPSPSRLRRSSPPAPAGGA